MLHANKAYAELCRKLWDNGALLVPLPYVESSSIFQGQKPLYMTMQVGASREAPQRFCQRSTHGKSKHVADGPLGYALAAKIPQLPGVPDRYAAGAEGGTAELGASNSSQTGCPRKPKGGEKMFKPFSPRPELLASYQAPK